MIERVENASVIAPLTPAFDRVKLMLFRPFDAGRWFVIGFCAWLATLGQGGANFGGNYGGGSRRGGREVFEEGRRYVLDNLSWLIPLVLVVVFLVVVIWLVFTWLSSRGRFMFLHCVRENAAEVQAPWTRYAAHGDSLFLFRVVLGLVSLALILPLVVGGVVLIIGLARSRGPEALPVLGAIVLVLLVIGLSVAFAVVAKLTTDFVVPIMALRHERCLDGWREFGMLVRSRPASFVVYLLFQLAIHLVIGVAVFALVLLTCCCAGCLLAIPYLGTVLFLPVLIFHRSYSLYFLAQFGPEYDLFPRLTTDLEARLPDSSI
jgi:hypothetical protein